MRKLSFLLLLTGLFSSCATISKWTNGDRKSGSEVRSLSFISEVEIPHDMSLMDTRIGGLSGITYDVKNKMFYVLSDDRSEYHPARFYSVTIAGWDQRPRVDFKQVTFLQANTGKPFSSKADYEQLAAKGKRPKYTTPDPEDIVYLQKEKKLVWVNEGERDTIGNIFVLQNPSVNLMEMSGRTITTYQLPKAFKMEARSGPERNKSIESVALSPSEEKLFIATEEPLMEEAADPASYDTGFVRIYQYRNATRTPETFYAYPLDIPNDPAIAHSGQKFGIAALYATNDSTLLVLERTYIPAEGNKVRLFKTILKYEHKVSARKSLKERKYFVPLEKELLFDFSTLEAVEVDNIEGMTMGPKIKGRQTMIFVSDNNFSEQQKTMFYFFWVN